MNHAELSKQLALAIGYTTRSAVISNAGNTCHVFRKSPGGERWVHFDYRDPSVALAMVELLAREKMYIGFYREQWWITGVNCFGETLPEATARAVIALKGVR